MQEVDDDNQDSKLPSIATIEERQNFAKTFSKNILDEFYQNRVPELEMQLQERRKQMEEEKERYDHIKRIKEKEFQKLESEAKDR